MSTSFPLGQPVGLDPAAEYGRLLADCPVSVVLARNGEPAWLVTRDADVRVVLRHPRFTSNPVAAGFPQLRPSPEQPPTPGTFLSLDPPAHTRFRRMLTGEFTVRRMMAHRPRIERIVDAQLDAMAAGPPAVDLVTAFARPVTAQVICALLGVPYAAREEFAENIAVRIDWSRPAEVVAAANAAVGDYLEVLVTEAELAPGDDLIGRLVIEQLRTGRLSHDELVGVAKLLLVAGLETTANIIPLGVVALQRDRAQWNVLCADSGRVDAAVEEMLRYLPVVHNGLLRAAMADVEVGGQLIRAGEGVIAFLPTANRDPAAFGQPDRFDVRRAPRRHLAFGAGVHQCIGQSLARVELQVAFRALSSRFPTLRLAVGASELTYQRVGAVFGARSLPVEW